MSTFIHIGDAAAAVIETSPELCIAAESSPGHLEMPDGSIAIPEIAVCWPPDPCVCEPEMEDVGS